MTGLIIKSSLNIFDAWTAARKVKEVKIDDACHETDDIGPIQTLTTPLAEMNEASVAFWFVGDVANSKFGTQLDVLCIVLCPG